MHLAHASPQSQLAGLQADRLVPVSAVMSIGELSGRVDLWNDLMLFEVDSACSAVALLQIRHDKLMELSSSIPSNNAKSSSLPSRRQGESGLAQPLRSVRSSACLIEAVRECEACI